MAIHSQVRGSTVGDDDQVARFRRARAQALALGAAALVLGLGIAATAWVVDFFDFASCPVSSAESNWGRQEWSVVPFGPRCVFTEEANGFDATRGPSWVWTANVVVAAVLLVLALVAVVRLLRMRPTFTLFR